jgi:tRNA nucleotidyltransferase (CCA-adding enzyme)
MTEQEFVQILCSAGGRVFIVGGWVRDYFRGVKPHDKDYVVCGLKESDFIRCFPQAEKVGGSFPVFLLPIEGRNAEIALARKERKSGEGYRGFAISADETVTIEEDLYRRDTTINSMALELPGYRLFDPFGGREDIRAHRIRAVSSHFLEDPVRALRAARQAAVFSYSVTEETLQYMYRSRQELIHSPTERIWGELMRALEADQPSRFFVCLREAGILEVCFPEIYALIGKTQPQDFHPEGDAFVHTMCVLDRVSQDTRSLMARFAALCHDLGKGLTPPEMLPHHYGHEIRGLTALQKWNKRMTIPREYRKAAAFVIREHMRAPRLSKPGKIVSLLLAIQSSPLSMRDFLTIIRADHGSDLPVYLEQGEALLKELLKISGRNCPKHLRGEEIGKWILEQRSNGLARLLSGNKTRNFL